MSASTAPGQQRRLDEYASDGQCVAISVSTGERCEHDSLTGIKYCADHFHLE